MKHIFLFGLCCVFVFPSMLLGQGGVSSTSVGIARAGFHHVDPSGTYRMPLPELIRVEEFINYHRHDLPLPDQGRRVRLDTQQLELENGKTILQIGLTTPRALPGSERPPLNIVVVVDESGSMAGKKHQQLKQALRSFVERFRPTDKIAIIGFEQEARTILASSEKTKLKKITRAINQIHAEGSTNLHAGLMCGYRTALKQFDPDRTNRLIFLTDGNANVGITESKEIARESKACIKRGISLVTIGLGVDFNHGLLRELADSGRGVMHYVGDSEDIKKTFVDEIDSVLMPAAKNVKLTVSFDQELSPMFYGYRPNVKRLDSKHDPTHGNRHGQSHVFRLDDLNYGATQIVLAKLRQADSRAVGLATLSYVDAITNEKFSTTIELGGLPKSKKSNLDSVRRNYAIASVANAIHAAAEVSNSGSNKRAEKRLVKGIQQAREISENRDDQHVNRVVEIATDYCKLLAGH